MVDTGVSEGKQRHSYYKIEFLIGILLSIPILLFVLFALIKDDFTILDHSYWVSIIVYNFAICIALWLNHSNRTLDLSPIILIYGLGLSIFLLAIYLEPFFTGDITEGVIAGSKVLWEGENPYLVEKVPHARPDSPEFRWTTYPYLPVDLLFYTIILGGMSIFSSILQNLLIPDLLVGILPGFNLTGFLITNLSLMGISIFLIMKILEIKFKYALLLGLVFFIILLWNNICFAQTLFFLGWYFHKRNQPNLTIFCWTMSMLAKYFAGIFIVAYIINYIRKKEYRESMIQTIIPVIMAVFFIVPFGLINVLKSTIFFYNSEQRTLDGSMGGSIVSELVLWLNLENIIWIFTLIGFILILIIAFLISNLYQRLITTSLLALLVISGISAQFFPMILFVFIYSNKINFFPVTKQENNAMFRNET